VCEVTSAPRITSNTSRIAALIPYSPLSWPLRIGRLAIAWLFISVGIAFMIRGKLGVAPIDSLIKGLSDRTGINFGLVFIGVSAVFYAIGWCLRSPPGPGSVIGSFVIGPTVSVTLGLIPHDSSLTARIVFFGIGLGFVAAGICFAISTNLGPGPSEVLMLGMRRIGVPLVASRWLVDGIHLMLGWLLGGPLGIGTAIFLVTMGPMVTVGLRWLNYSPDIKSRS
jgi:uncharacterized membrane protein YczE